MPAETLVHIAATRAELAAAEEHLAAALNAPIDDDCATALIAAANERLRASQARHTAARSGVAHLPQLMTSS